VVVACCSAAAADCSIPDIENHTAGLIFGFSFPEIFDKNFE